MSILEKIDNKDKGFNSLADAIEIIQNDKSTKSLIFLARNSVNATILLEKEMLEAMKRASYRVAASIFLTFAELGYHEKAIKAFEVSCEKSWMKALIQSYKLKTSLD